MKDKDVIEVEISQAFDILVKHLSSDKGYYHSWKDNIAMAFKDEYKRFNPNMHECNKEILHRIANNAANNFLDQLIQLKPNSNSNE